MRRVLGFAVVLVALAQRGDADPKRVEILHAPHIVTDDTEIGFDVRALPDPANRVLVIAAIDEVGFTARRSDEPLDLESPVTRRIEWLSLSAGDYELIAQTVGVNEKPLARDQWHLTVLEWRGP